MKELGYYLHENKPKRFIYPYTMMLYKTMIPKKADKEEGIYNNIWQAFTVLLPVNSVGVMGDKRTYEYVACIRSVNTIDFMTATFSRLSYDFLDLVASRIINEVKRINRVVYDITSKPPGTIEWE